MSVSILRRAFSAAKLSSALAGWISAPLSPNNDIAAGLRPLRARSREAAQNDDHSRHFLRLVETNIVGPRGVHMRSMAPGELAGRVEDAYERQSERGTWDVTGQYSRTAFSRLGVRTVAMDGEILIRIREGESFSVELIDPEALDILYNDELSDGRYVSMGVEYDEVRRPLAYHMLAREPVRGNGIYSGYASYGGTRTRIPAGEMLHIYLPEWIWQGRGVPWQSTALIRMKMLTGYEEAAITAARGAAIKSGVYTQNPDPTSPNSMPAGIADGETLNQMLEPGQKEMLPPGWDLKPLDWSWPNFEHGDFVRECLRGIASGLGVGYNTLANDLSNVNYSSLRQGALLERELWVALQEWWIEWVERPLYRAWLQWAASSGQFGTLGPRVSERIDRASFQGRRWSWVDPLKDMQAAELAVKMRTRSISDIIREQGRDPDEVWTELAADRERLAGMGLSIEDPTK